MSEPADLRDQFAGQVLGSLIASYTQFGRPEQRHDFREAAPILCEMAYFAADCMLAERARPSMFSEPPK